MQSRTEEQKEFIDTITKELERLNRVRSGEKTESSETLDHIHCIDSLIRIYENSSYDNNFFDTIKKTYQSETLSYQQKSKNIRDEISDEISKEFKDDEQVQRNKEPYNIEKAKPYFDNKDQIRELERLFGVRENKNSKPRKTVSDSVAAPKPEKQPIPRHSSSAPPVAQRKLLDKDGIELIEWTINESKKHRTDPQLNQAADSVMQIITIALNLQNNNHENTEALAGISNAISKYKEQLTRSGYSTKGDPILDILSRNNLTDPTPVKKRGFTRQPENLNRKAIPTHSGSDPTSEPITRSPSNPKPPTKANSARFYQPKTDPHQQEIKKLQAELKKTSDNITAIEKKIKDPAFVGDINQANMIMAQLQDKLLKQMKVLALKLQEKPTTTEKTLTTKPKF